MDIIKKFLHSPWSKKGKTIIKDPAKMTLLLGKLRNYMGKGGLASIREDLTVVYNYVKDIVGGRYREYSSGNLALIAGAVVYLVSPLDFVADFIPFGLVDDVAIISWALNRMGDELERYRLWRGKEE
ncbi:MAG: DUF1232 domain-containing protein [Bacteroidaceae bacterium]|nr:DUF1232 domain-containing protein [Bacteroidaceae bacterium]